MTVHTNRYPPQQPNPDPKGWWMKAGVIVGVLALVVAIAAMFFPRP
jgi:hypothetical protein